MAVRRIEQATDTFVTQLRSRTLSQASRRIARNVNESLRMAIDVATPAETTGDVHSAAAAMVAEDARLETRHSDAIASLAQIPPVRIGRVTYRVLAEEVNNGQRKIALLCRTRASTLAQHRECGCIICVYVKQALCTDGCIDSFRRWNEVEVWHHDKTKTYHLRRIKDGAFLELPRTIKHDAYGWAVHINHHQPAFATTADGRVS